MDRELNYNELDQVVGGGAAVQASFAAAAPNCYAPQALAAPQVFAAPTVFAAPVVRQRARVRFVARYR